MSRKLMWSDEELQLAVASSTGITEVVRKLYGKWTGGSYQLVRGKIIALSLDTRHFTQRRVRAPVRQPDSYFLSDGRELSSKKVRELLRKCRSYECVLCSNTGSHNGLPLVLHVDHVDGDRSNNKIDNLRWLCPNCHSQTATYGSKNSRKREIQKLATVNMACSGCSNTFEADKRSVQLKQEDGQKNFFCSLSCVNLVKQKATDEQILKLRAEGLSVTSVAKTFGMSSAAVYYRLSEIRSRTMGSLP